MGRIAESWHKRRSTTGPVVSTAPGLEDFPELASLLRGELQGNGKEWARCPYKLLLWLSDTQIEFCFTHKGCREKLWGSFPSLAEGLSALEQALCKGHCSWKDADQDENGFTQHRK